MQTDYKLRRQYFPSLLFSPPLFTSAMVNSISASFTRVQRTECIIITAFPFIQMYTCFLFYTPLFQFTFPSLSSFSFFHSLHPVSHLERGKVSPVPIASTLTTQTQTQRTRKLSSSRNGQKEDKKRVTTATANFIKRLQTLKKREEDKK